jgi:hypothetical protein
VTVPEGKSEGRKASPPPALNSRSTLLSADEKRQWIEDVEKFNALSARIVELELECDDLAERIHVAEAELEERRKMPIVKTARPVAPTHLPRWYTG